MPVTKQLVHGFFGDTTVENHQKTVFIDFGDHNGDSLLRSIAAAILYKIAAGQPLDKKVLHVLMSSYLKCFPLDKAISVNVTEVERIQQLLRHERIGKLIQKVAFTLEHLIFNEIKDLPSYADLFIDGQLTSTAITHDHGLTIMTILAGILKGLPFEIQVVERNKPLFNRICFNTEKQNPHSVVLQSDRGHYRARIGSNYFGSAVVPAVSLLHQNNNAQAQLPHLSENANLVTEEEKLVEAFEAVYRPLFSMLVASELSANDLIEIYQRTSKSVGSNNKRFSQSIFDKVITSQSRLDSINDPSERKNREFGEYIIYNIAQAVSFGQMCKDEVFEGVDVMLTNRRHFTSMGTGG